MSEWISVFDRLPEEEGDYLVTWEVEDTWGNPIRRMAIFWYGEGSNDVFSSEETQPTPHCGWFESKEENAYEREIPCVIAWRELPEVYVKSTDTQLLANCLDGVARTV